ncbi:hypothetical protein [Caballeronia sp. ATUFL_M2_KS44]|uniref:hypothetical protein n=1 Tax=Caballeronia sp. ATUFL_M2_KS44 TaxID=2921767 RepID=UPI002027E23C|nr:hypothetical protein [Caballeronia sp. ATUFL_M2_KS44]
MICSESTKAFGQPRLTIPIFGAGAALAVDFAGVFTGTSGMGTVATVLVLCRPLARGEFAILTGMGLAAFFAGVLAPAHWALVLNLFSRRSISSPLPGAGVTFFAAAKKVTKESSFFARTSFSDGALRRTTLALSLNQP